MEYQIKSINHTTQGSPEHPSKMEKPQWHLGFLKETNTIREGQWDRGII